MQGGDDERFCHDCCKWLPEASFAYKHIALRARQSRCRACQSARSREHYQRNSSSYIRRARAMDKRTRAENRLRLHALLEEAACLDCGTRDFAVLEFDHRDPATKAADVSTLVRTARPWSRVVSEITKCDVVCANCHRRRTARQFACTGSHRTDPSACLHFRSAALPITSASRALAVPSRDVSAIASLFGSTCKLRCVRCAARRMPWF
jgi:hypothetical protein